MGKIRNEAGFSAVGVLLILIVMALIGGIGYFVYRSNQEAATTSTTESTDIASAVDYVGWKAHYSLDEKFMIKYPDGWTVVEESPAGNLKESIILQGPNNFALTYALVKYDTAYTVAFAQEEASTRGNPDPVKSNAYGIIDSFSPAGFSQALYAVSTSSDVGEAGGLVNTLQLSGYKEYQAQPLGYSGYYLSKNNPGYIVQWFGGHSKAAPDSGPVGMPTATFLAKPEVKIATQILGSISY